MAQILNGKLVRDVVQEELKKYCEQAASQPALAIIQVGNRPDSTAYINQKKKFGDYIGAKVIHIIFPESVTEQEVMEKIHELNDDTNVHGIIVQIPLPPHFNKFTLIEGISPEKDVDGLTAVNTKRFIEEIPEGSIPATARGVCALLHHYGISVAHKAVTVVGKSSLVGKPIALSMMRDGATVTVCHKQTGDLVPFTKNADIIIVAAGHRNLIGKEHVSPGQIIIDVGINEILGEDGKRAVVGDVDFANVESVVAAITPVPGGVGPMTVASLFLNLIDSHKRIVR